MLETWGLVLETTVIVLQGKQFASQQLKQWRTTLALKWLKQATFPVVLASVFSFMFSIHQLLMISIHHAVVKLLFSFFPSYCWYCSIIVHIYILKYKDPFSERGTAAAHESTQLSSSRTILR